MNVPLWHSEHCLKAAGRAGPLARSRSDGRRTRRGAKKKSSPWGFKSFFNVTKKLNDISIVKYAMVTFKLHLKIILASCLRKMSSALFVPFTGLSWHPEFPTLFFKVKCTLESFFFELNI